MFSKCLCLCLCLCHCLCICLCQFFWSCHVFSSLWTNVSKIASLLGHSVMSEVKVPSVSESVSQWQGHLLSCSGQLKQYYIKMWPKFPTNAPLVSFSHKSGGYWMKNLNNELENDIKYPTFFFVKKKITIQVWKVLWLWRKASWRREVCKSTALTIDGLLV